MNTPNRFSQHAHIVIRLALAILFIWFGILQGRNPGMWTGFVPHWVTGMFNGNAVMLVYMNAWFEIIAGLCLLVGFQVRIVSILLALHLFFIAGSIGITPLGLRDFTLAFAMLSVAIAGADAWSVDMKFKRKEAAQRSQMREQ